MNYMITLHRGPVAFPDDPSETTRDGVVYFHPPTDTVRIRLDAGSYLMITPASDLREQLDDLLADAIVAEQENIVDCPDCGKPVVAIRVIDQQGVRDMCRDAVPDENGILVRNPETGDYRLLALGEQPAGLTYAPHTLHSKGGEST